MSLFFLVGLLYIPSVNINGERQMSVQVSDLIPKPFTVKIKGVELECKPLRLSHILTVTKIGKTFQSVETASRSEIKTAERDFDELVAELIPELKDIELDAGSSTELIQQLVESVEPEDNKELKANGVQLNTDPKAQTEKIG